MFRNYKKIDLRAWRKAMGYTQKRSVEALGVDIRTFQRWEAAGQAPSTAHELCRILKDLKKIS